MNLNKVVLIGRLTQDPELRATPSGQSVATLRMATNRTWTNQATGQRQDATEYHTVIAWGRLGEIAGQYLKKGGLAMIEGRLQTRNWTGQDNVKRYVTEIVAENLQLGPRTASAGAPAAAPMSDMRPATAANGPAAPAGDSAVLDDIPIINENELTNPGVEEHEVKIKEEDLPF